MKYCRPCWGDVCVHAFTVGRTRMALSTCRISWDTSPTTLPLSDSVFPTHPPEALRSSAYCCRSMRSFRATETRFAWTKNNNSVSLTIQTRLFAIRRNLRERIDYGRFNRNEARLRGRPNPIKHANLATVEKCTE